MGRERRLSSGLLLERELVHLVTSISRVLAAYMAAVGGLQAGGVRLFVAKPVMRVSKATVRLVETPQSLSERVYKGD